MGMSFQGRSKKQPNLARRAGKIMMMGRATVKGTRRLRSAKGWGLVSAANKMKAKES